VEVLMRRLLNLALLLAALFLTLKLLGAAGVFVFAAVYALFLLAKSFFMTKPQSVAESPDRSPRSIRQTDEKMYSGQVAPSKNLAIALFLFFVLVSLAFVLISGELEWLGTPRIGIVKKITSSPALSFGEAIYPHPSLKVTEDLKYQVIYFNPSDQLLSTVVITVELSLKPQGLALLLPGAKFPVTKTLILENVPPRAIGVLNIPVDPPILKIIGAPWRFLLPLIDTTWLQLFWSTILAVLTAVLIAAAILLPIGYFSSRVTYGEYEEYKWHEWEAIYSTISVVLGINKGVWLVKEGKAQVLYAPAGSLARFGGPGVLIVQEGHAVILEKSGSLSRVVGKGLTWLQAFERVSMVVPLQTRGEQVIVKQVATKDKILIDEFEFWVYHKVDLGPEERRIQSGLYAYNEDILLKKVWAMDGEDWRGAIKALSETAARDVVGRYDLEQILPISDEFRIGFKDALRQQINRIAKDFMGVDIIAVDIGEIKVPEEAQSKLLKRWISGVDVQVAEKEGERLVAEAKGKRQAAEIDAGKILEEARARAEAAMIKGRGDAEAEAERFRRMLALVPSVDRETLLAIFKQLQSDEYTKNMVRFFRYTDERRYLGRTEPPLPSTSTGEEAEE
jgi:regulator of protease activity HflC (stomatin/prohibitin superfamily)